MSLLNSGADASKATILEAFLALPKGTGSTGNGAIDQAMATAAQTDAFGLYLDFFNLGSVAALAPGRR